MAASWLLQVPGKLRTSADGCGRHSLAAGSMHLDLAETVFPRLCWTAASQPPAPSLDLRGGHGGRAATLASLQAARFWQAQRRAPGRGKRAPRLLPVSAIGTGGGGGAEEQLPLLLPHDQAASSPDISPPPPPSSGRLEIIVSKDEIRRLDLGPAHALLHPYMHSLGDWATSPVEDVARLLDSRVGFTIRYDRDDPLDPRELSELPDVRLWFVRLDVAYPWLPAVLDWRGGELGRYAAMLVPHQMSRRMGLVFNPEALELWVMKKVFVVFEWLKLRNVARPEARVRDMMKVLGFSASDSLFHILEEDTS